MLKYNKRVKFGKYLFSGFMQAKKIQAVASPRNILHKLEPNDTLNVFKAPHLFKDKRLEAQKRTRIPI